jgi:UDP-galactopyranose mutase
MQSAPAKVLVVGAGFAGSVIARELADAGISVDLIDQRPHLGGNAFDQVNQHGERIHLYGPHLLHGDKNSRAVQWLSKFTEWTEYEHRVRALLPDGRTTPLPVNRTTLEDVYNIKLKSDQEAKRLLEKEVCSTDCRNSDEVFLSYVGQRLADLFFRPYTRKMWGIEATQLEPAVGARLPVRLNRDDRYFTDTFQAMPKDGYTAMFERVLDHRNISVNLGQSFRKELMVGYAHTFLSMPIDEYFDYQLGRLPYRSIRFEHIESMHDQPSTVLNYTDQGVYTRITQWDLIPNSGRRGDGLHSCTREIPCNPIDNHNERYYPVRNKGSLGLLSEYGRLAEQEQGITFIGRTGLFRYIDMIPCVSLHLQIAKKFLDVVRN